MDNENEKKTAADVVGGFFARTKIFWIVFLAVVVVAVIAISVVATVNNKAAKSDADFLEDTVSVYLDAKNSLEGDELKAAGEKYAAELEAFAGDNGKNNATVRAYMMLGEYYFADSDWQKALDSWLKAAAAGKSYLSGISYYNAAVCYEQLADVENAKKYYDMAIKCEDFELKAHAMFNYGRLLETEGKKSEAVDMYKNLVSKYADSTWADLVTSRLIVLDNAETTTDGE